MVQLTVQILLRRQVSASSIGPLGGRKRRGRGGTGTCRRKGGRVPASAMVEAFHCVPMACKGKTHLCYGVNRRGTTPGMENPGIRPLKYLRATDNASKLLGSLFASTKQTPD